MAYTGIQNRAYDAVIRSDLENAAKALEMARTDLGRYPAATNNDWLPTNNFKFSKSAHATDVNTALYCLNIATDSYALGVVSKSGRGYILTRDGVVEDVGVSGASVCGAVDTTWVNNATTTTRHGYNPSGTSSSWTNGWSNTWPWTN